MCDEDCPWSYFEQAVVEAAARACPVAALHERYALASSEGPGLERPHLRGVRVC